MPRLDELFVKGYHAPVSTHYEWIGTAGLLRGETRYWAIGTLRLAASLSTTGARVIIARTEDPADASMLVASMEPDEGAKVATTELQRTLSTRATEVRVELSARSADRSLVVRPDGEVIVAPGSEVEVYITAPVWVQVRIDGSEVVDVPTWRLSDTWFGANTVDGSLAYAGRTRLSTDLESVQSTPGRSITRARLRNGSKIPFGLDRMSLPAPAMSLYAGKDGRIWTDAVEVEVAEDGPASVRLLEAPRAAAESQRIGDPREPSGPGTLVAAFSSWLGGKG